jgi:hypothetical protein
MFSFGKTKPEESLSALETLREAHCGLATLPDAIRVPAVPGQDAIDAKPITEVTLDDIAFALRGLEAASNALIDQMYALRKLSQIARDAGGLGADRAVDVATRATKER